MFTREESINDFSKSHFSFLAQRALRCPFGLSTFSANSAKSYFQCQPNGVSELKTCPKEEFYWAKFGRCMNVDRKERDSTDVKYLSDVPVLGRNVQVGKLFLGEN